MSSLGKVLLLPSCESHIHLSRISEKLSQLEKLFSPVAAEEIAESSCSDYEKLPSDVESSDQKLLTKLGSIVAVVQYKQRLSAESGFNIQRVKATCLPSDPHFDTLCSLATDGAVIQTDESFVNTVEPPPLRPVLSRLPRTFKFHATKLHRKQKVLIVKLSDISQSERQLMHMNDAHWTPKQLCPQGRPCIDPSNPLPNKSCLNTPECKELTEACYGKATNVSISTIYTDMFMFCQLHNVKLKDCRMWKGDVSSAFAQFCWSPLSCLLMAMMIDPVYVMLSLNGNFGHHSAPTIWFLIAISILIVLLRIIRGLSWVYVDDFLGLSLAHNAHFDQQCWFTVTKSMLGPDAISDDKTVLPTLRTDLLGWDTCLVAERSMPNQKGCDKLLHSFFRFDFSKPQPLSVWQLLASLAERYSLGLVGMRSFVTPFHHMTRKFGPDPCRHATARPTSSVLFCIQIWRAVSILLFYDRESMSVPMLSMSKFSSSQTPCFFGISDASPNGVGAAIIRAADNKLIAYTKLMFPFAPDVDTKYQNIREFLGALTMLVLLHVVSPSKQSKVRGAIVTVRWTNDNMSALTWVQNNKCSSRCGQHASYALTVFQLRTQLTITDCVHIPGTEMLDNSIDALSRDFPTPDLDPSCFVNIVDQTPILELLRLCDPTINQDVVDHFSALSMICKVISKF